MTGSDARAPDSSGNLVCTYCGDVMTAEPRADNSREFDHVDPWADTMELSAGNIVSACKVCNLGPGGTGRRSQSNGAEKEAIQA
jgi:5-methylcytosine-specific restriction endonuclease McrA